MHEENKPFEACTSFVLKTVDQKPVYGRTCEWGLSEAHANVVMVPRGYMVTARLSQTKLGATWTTRYGFVGINGEDLPYYLDGMNEAGLTLGALYLPGFAGYQQMEPGQETSTITNLDLGGYLLGLFSGVEEIKEALPDLCVTEAGKDLLEIPMPLHYLVTDSSGRSIVIEYVEGRLNIHDNTIGVMTNSPTFGWHVMNLRNYTSLTPYAPSPGTDEVDGANFTPFSQGAGMAGLPGDYTSTARFVRAFIYKQTSAPLENIDAAINQATRILDNFDYPLGFLREGTPEQHTLGRTQWSTIGDIANKRYFWWTEWNRQLRMVDLSQLDFGGTEVVSTPLDKTRAESIDERTSDLMVEEGAWRKRMAT